MSVFKQSVSVRLCVGVFYVGIWRQKGYWWKYYQFVAQNKITVTKTGKQR